MAVQIVFSGDLDPENPNLSTRFSEATSFFIQAPLINSELEIDVYLQVYMPGVIGETARNIPLGKIVEQTVLLNVTDTETANLIPIEYQNTGLEMALLFSASDTTYLYAIVIKPDCNICQLSSQNNDIQMTLANMQITLQQIKNAVGVPASSASANTASEQFFYLQ